MDMVNTKPIDSFACCTLVQHTMCSAGHVHVATALRSMNRYKSTSGVRLCCRHWGGTEVGRSRSICVFVVVAILVSVPDSCEIYGTTSGNECNVSYVILHASDLRYGRQIDIHIRCTAPYSAARETTTSVGLAHARPIISAGLLRYRYQTQRN